MSIKIDELQKAVSETLDDYFLVTTEIMQKAAQETAEDAKRTLQTEYPYKDGKKAKYTKGWRITGKRGRVTADYIVHNTQYQLTHLLEYGHALKRGGRKVGQAKAYPHIANAEEKAIKRYEEILRRELGQ